MFDDFFVRALAAAVGVAVVACPLGCFVVWRRMAYFGDTMAHSALLGVALGVVAGIDLTVGVAIAAILVALALYGLQRAETFATDTLLGILAHAALAIGLVVIGVTGGIRLDLIGYLFGDILAVDDAALATIWAGGAGVLAVLALAWRRLLAITIDRDLAAAEGTAPAPIELLFMLLIAIVVALAMQMVGILLITAMLIIPAAAARPLARTPEQMAIAAAGIGASAAVLGLIASLQLDTPAGPSIVVVATMLFLATAATAALRRG
ncbi:MAG: metal ABC transporter permease [Alphaproteobacteria bacterium]